MFLAQFLFQRREFKRDHVGQEDIFFFPTGIGRRATSAEGWRRQGERRKWSVADMRELLARVASRT